MPGSGTVPVSASGAVSGKMLAWGSASFIANSGSGRDRRMVTVPAASSAATPSSAQPAGARRQASAPWIAP